jgi:serine O-acetyltransferase
VTGIDDAKDPDELPLRALLREDVASHHRDLLSPGLHTVVVHRLGRRAATRKGLSGRLARRATTCAYAFVRNVYGMELPFTVRVGRRVVLAHQSSIVVNEATRIGNDVLIRHGVTLGQPRHELDGVAPDVRDGVHIGPNAVIMGGVVIGEGARIGPLAHVIHDVPAGAAVIAPLADVRPRRDLRRDLDAGASSTLAEGTAADAAVTHPEAEAEAEAEADRDAPTSDLRRSA